MASQINYVGINENFPVAGQDNDTQVFRDNFDTIKTSLRVAGEEITTLQTDTAKLTESNDFALNTIENAVLHRVRELKVAKQNYESGAGVDWQDGSYHIYDIVSNSTMEIKNLPGDPSYTSETTPIGFGKLTLELYGNGTSLTFSTSGGASIKAFGFPTYTPGTPPTVSLTSTSNPVIIEVWRHSADYLLMRYIGQFA